MSTHHEGGVSIWFFIGISLLVNGMSDLWGRSVGSASSAREPDDCAVSICTPMFGGAGSLAVAGLLYTVLFIPGRNRS